MTTGTVVTHVGIQQESNVTKETGDAQANPEEISKGQSNTKPKFKSQVTRTYHGNMGKWLNLGSLGPGFDPEALHLLSGAKIQARRKG